MNSRSGALRKVTYPLPIYKAEELDKDPEYGNIFRIADKLKTDEEFCYQYEKDKPLWKKSSSQKQKPSTCTSESIGSECPKFEECQVEVIPESEYSNLYPAKLKAMPRFPIIVGSDLLTEPDDSDYDIDTEDEEWLESHSDYNITASRLEHIFAKLNKTDTHISSKAISAFKPSYHQDFHRVFAYWKYKRQRKTNFSTYKPKIPVKERRFSSTTDPYMCFLSKARKIARPVSRNYERFSKSDLQTLQQKVKLAQNSLEKYKAVAAKCLVKAEEKREELLKRSETLFTSCTEKENCTEDRDVEVRNEIRKAASVGPTSGPANRTRRRMGSMNISPHSM